MRRPLVDRRAAESTNAGSASSLAGGDRITFVSERDGNSGNLHSERGWVVSGGWSLGSRGCARALRLVGA